ncbi:chromosome replication initiation membrane attachment protein [Liquorilactobacillus aquaticus DSM 21051]|uniref:Chromosome replication initiation membrane attachment protein n=1 Tax=Liquorilactobacillus aquaticus DSM 21051 TaxID=1423725 RepID=A0A0R2CXH6_9LACO|nr:DnaD domain protein [Liquorilactobacillus aquaticus]KRM96622.1 chromosome replication initiation membrane attachment protein [Liquorilactobacillus aquaticus DSM 21051]
MNGGWQEMSPRDGYVVVSNEVIFDSDMDVILRLYQPLMGVTAFGLYSLLRTQIEMKPQISVRKMHTRLFDLLGIGLQPFFEARCKLEALGLLRTFEKKDELGKLDLYIVQPPQKPLAFFKDDLLRALLLETVGEEYFNELQSTYLPNRLTNFKGTETTKHFLDVFSLQTQALYNAANAEQGQTEEIPKGIILDEDKSGFDMRFLQQMLAKSFIDVKQVMERKEKVLVAHEVYGLDELEVTQLLEEAANVQTNKVDFQVFMSLLHQKYSDREHLRSIIPKDKTDIVASKTAASENSGLNKADQALLNACKAYAPAEFLRVLKSEKGTFVTTAERNTLEWVSAKRLFNNAVINILIHYMIVDRGMSVLNRAFFEAVVADWAQKKIKDPKEAMKQVRTFNSKKRQKNYPSSGYSKKSRRTNVVQKEELPDWAQEGYKPKQVSTVSEEERKKIKEKLSRFRKKK